MFFADPVAAYGKLRGALVPGGRLTMLVWQAPKHNPWMSVVGQAVAPFLPPPSGGAPDPRAPGPFAFADPAYVTGLLEAAGWESISLSPVERPLHLADTMEEALALQSQVDPSRGCFESWRKRRGRRRLPRHGGPGPSLHSRRV